MQFWQVMLAVVATIALSASLYNMYAACNTSD